MGMQCSNGILYPHQGFTKMNCINPRDTGSVDKYYNVNNKV